MHFCVQGRPSPHIPPLLDDRSLFTKAATYGDQEDPFYHSPSSRIGSYYTPSAGRAGDLLDKVNHQQANGMTTELLATHSVFNLAVFFSHMHACVTCA